MMIRRLACAFCGLVLTALGTEAADLPDPEQMPVAFLRAAIGRLCLVPEPDPATLAAPFRGATVVSTSAIEFRDRPLGWRATIRLRGGEMLRIDRRSRQGKLRGFSVDLYGIGGGDSSGRHLRPIVTGRTGPDCRIFAGRRIRYDAEGRRSELESLGPDLAEIERREALNPPIPPGRNPGGVLVALFDAGLNYTLPQFAQRLARAPNGRALGFDFWDMDSRPFDGNPARSPFYPVRHGTPVASALLREAPRVRLLPYRYPRPDMTRMAAMVQAAEANGAVIVSMPMGSNKAEHWTAFVDAARARPHMLFIVSAGNNGRDIDALPVYPAAFDLDNLLVVTSSTPTGRLARGSNWGARSVDLMIPAENVEITDFTGAPGTDSGSSYAVARVAALAARLLAKHPNWTAPKLKGAILARAQPLPDGQTALVKHGWIADPAKD